MTTITKTVSVGFVAAALVAGLCGLGQQAAEARSAPGLVGTPAFGVDRHCFTEEFGGVKNRDCAGWKAWILPAIYDNAGNMNMSVRARGLSGTARRVQCNLISIDGFGNNARFGTTRLTSLQTGQTEALNISVNAHGFGGTFAFCWLQQGTLIRSYHY